MRSVHLSPLQPPPRQTAMELTRPQPQKISASEEERKKKKFAATGKINNRRDSIYPRSPKSETEICQMRPYRSESTLNLLHISPRNFFGSCPIFYLIFLLFCLSAAEEHFARMRLLLVSSLLNRAPPAFYGWSVELLFKLHTFTYKINIHQSSEAAVHLFLSLAHLSSFVVATAVTAPNPDQRKRDG